MTQPSIVTTLQRLVVPVAVVATVVSLAAAAGPVLWRLASVDTPPQVQQRATDAGPVAPDLTVVLAAHPFGAAEIVPGAPVSTVGDADLGLQLLGVMQSATPGRSGAIIAGPDGKAANYLINREVLTGVTLSEVAADHVVLLVNTTPQVLYFPDAKPAVGAAESTATEAAVAPDPKPASRSGVDGLLALVAPGAPVYGEPDADTSRDPDAVIARYRAAIRQNPASVMLRLGIEATAGGYVIKDMTSPGVLSAGFKPGDVVTSVNGETVGDVTADVDLFDRIAEAGLARVELNRAGKQIMLSFPLR